MAQAVMHPLGDAVCRPGGVRGQTDHGHVAGVVRTLRMTAGSETLPDVVRVIAAQ
jgi:hypothetical protein